MLHTSLLTQFLLKSVRLFIYKLRFRRFVKFVGKLVIFIILQFLFLQLKNESGSGVVALYVFLNETMNTPIPPTPRKGVKVVHNPQSINFKFCGIVSWKHRIV